MEIRRHQILGAISGSSLDGLDLAILTFYFNMENGHPVLHRWKMEQAATIPFPEALSKRLENSPHMSGRELVQLDADLGKWMGEQARQFLDSAPGNQVEFLCSHGHTVFHEPANGMTCQIGNGAHLAETCGIPVINDVRYADVAAGGTGAPFAPLADKYLYPGSDFYLNLGGISNLTHMLGEEPIAWDISGCNQLLNHLSRKLGHAYDKNGAIARKGRVIEKLLEKLHQLLPFQVNEPVVLDNQQVVNLYFPVLDNQESPVEDLLHTSTVYIAEQISRTVSQLRTMYGLQRDMKLFATGGGALNGFMMELLREMLAHENTELVIPDQEVIEFKEAALLALVGLFRKYEIPNSLPSVTFAQRAPIGGAFHIPSK